MVEEDTKFNLGQLQFEVVREALGTCLSVPPHLKKMK